TWAPARSTFWALPGIIRGTVSARSVLRLLLLIASAAYLLALIIVAVAHMIYPFPIDPTMDGAALDQVQRILNGQPLYAAPSLEYVPFIYTPLYYCISAVVALLTGPTLFNLRLVSSAASVATFVLLYRFVFRETQSHTASFVACGVLAGCYSETGRALDAARVDALFVCFLLAMLYLVRSSEL